MLIWIHFDSFAIIYLILEVFSSSKHFPKEVVINSLQTTYKGLEPVFI